MNIINKKDFFNIKEMDVMDEKKINLIVNKIKNISPEKYENYGKNTIIDYAKSILLKQFYFNCIVEIKENVFVKWEDFTQLIRFENGKITQRFIGGLYNINLCDKSGNYLDSKLHGMLLIDFKCESDS